MRKVLRFLPFAIGFYLAGFFIVTGIIKLNLAIRVYTQFGERYMTISVYVVFMFIAGVLAFIYGWDDEKR